VFPVPVAPVANMIESLKKPPPHILSRMSSPEETLTFEERCLPYSPTPPLPYSGISHTFLAN
ncbi:MAG: hypothetical protein SWX82_27745, partial [Cyanobacteriota bacterium]|nr:hypothetical protein [Cyanobacteriota bacterium]